MTERTDSAQRNGAEGWGIERAKPRWKRGCPPENLPRTDSAQSAEWWRGRESNPRHVDFQSTALPAELPRQILRFIFARAKPLMTVTGMGIQSRRVSASQFPGLAYAPRLARARANRKAAGQTFFRAASGASGLPFSVFSIPAASAGRPSVARSLASISLRISRFASRNCRTFSRPCPSRSPL